MPKLSPEKEQAVEERRWKIWRLRVVRKADLTEIVKLLGVSRRTVVSDLAVMRDVRLEHIRLAVAEQQATIDAAIEVAESCDAVVRQAWTDLEAADKGSFARAKFLNTILNAVRWKIEVLQAVGLLPRQPDEMILTEGSGIRDLSDQEGDKLLAMLKILVREGTSLEDFERQVRRDARTERRRVTRQIAAGNETA
jgi:hypothetical protein